jgi:hypothetical protein
MSVPGTSPVSGGVRLVAACTLASSFILANHNREILTHTEHRGPCNIVAKRQLWASSFDCDGQGKILCGTIYRAAIAFAALFRAD